MAGQLRPLMAASAKMFYRSIDTVWFAAVSPLLMLAMAVLAKRLHFEVAHSAARISFFTFLAIGWAAFIAAHINQDGTVGTASGYRDQGVLKRVAVTPVSPLAFIAAQIAVRVLVGVIQTAVFLGAAVGLGAHIDYTPDLVWILPLAVIALLTGTGFGFAIAGAANGAEAANQLNIGLFTPVFLLAGVQYPLQGLPGVLPQIAEYFVPFAAAIQAFREAVAGHLAGDFPRLIVISLAWLAIVLALAVRAYRFGEDR